MDSGRYKMDNIKVKAITDKVGSRLVDCYKKFTRMQKGGFGKEFLNYIEAFGGKRESKHYIMAAGIEMFLEAGYIIDDLSDGDDTRGNGPSFHKLVEQEMKLSQKESSSVSTHFAFLLEHISQKIMRKFGVFDDYERIKLKTLKGQIDEEILKKDGSYKEIYKEKTSFITLPLKIAAKICGLNIDKAILDGLVLCDQKIDDINDLLTKNTHLRNNNNTNLKNVFGKKLRDRGFIRNNVDRLVKIAKESLEDYNVFMNLIKDKCYKPPILKKISDQYHNYVNRIISQIKATALLDDKKYVIDKIYEKWYAKNYEEIFNTRWYIEDCKTISNILKKEGTRKGIIELCCGTGRNLNILKGCGFDVEGVEGSSSMVGVAKIKYPYLNISEQNLLNFKPNDKYNAILILGYAINYLSEMEIKGVVRNCFSWMAPGGRLFISIIDKESCFFDKTVENKTLSDGTKYTSFWKDNGPKSVIYHEIFEKENNIKTKLHILKGCSKDLMRDFMISVGFKEVSFHSSGLGEEDCILISAKKDVD